MATAKLLDDVTECPICTEVYTDPRLLPCVHTYCLKCIEAWSKDKQPGDKLVCPLCRKEYILPSSGVRNLPKNFSVVNLLEMNELLNAESAMPFSNCSTHVAEQMRIYCQDCKVPACIACYIESHNSHKWSTIAKAADHFRQQMTGDVDNVATGFDKCTDMLERLEKEKNDFVEQVAKAEMEISEKAEQLKQMIDCHKEKLMNELLSMKQKRMKEIESLREEIGRQTLSMERYRKEVDEVRQKGTACDITRAASDLHDRADELLKFDVIERTLDDLCHADVTFTSSNVVIDDVSKTFGRLCLRTVAKLLHVIPTEDQESVTAMTSLGDDVFVVHWGRKQIEVYHAETAKLQRHIKVPGLVCPRGITACSHYKCLYLSDSSRRSDNNIHRVELSGSNAVNQWSVACDPRGLSVNKEHNVVVACWRKNKILVYTTHGILVRDICLQAGVTSPYHAVQMSSGHYVVSQYTSPGVVSVVGVDGQVVHRYEGQMSDPRILSVTKNDDILVADQGNQRILPMNSNCLLRILSVSSLLSFVQELTLPADDEIHHPLALYLDESRGRLYVGERRGVGLYRVMVFNVTL